MSDWPEIGDTSDIVERLTDAADAIAGEPGEALYLQAYLLIKRLRARIIELEATLAATMGTLAPRHNERAVEPFSIEHNVPGNAPV